MLWGSGSINGDYYSWVSAQLPFPLGASSLRSLGCGEPLLLLQGGGTGKAGSLGSSSPAWFLLEDSPLWQGAPWVNLAKQAAARLRSCLAARKWLLGGGMPEMKAGSFTAQPNRSAPPPGRPAGGGGGRSWLAPA